MTLYQTFEELRGTRMLFVEPGGNWGDYLIYFGAEKLAHQAGIEIEKMSIKEFLARNSDDSNVYIHGGGGFNEWCSGASFDCLGFALQNYKNTVVYGPCTTSINVPFLNERFSKCFENTIAKRVIIFAREQLTYDLLQRVDATRINAEINIDHDTALHLTKQDLLERAGEEANNYTLFGYRIDNESSSVKLQPSCLRCVFDPPMYATSFEHWIRIHAHAKKIITNRTHSSIAGAILEKDTTLFASKYHKNESIWKYSLKQKGVTWADDDTATHIIKPTLLETLVPSVLHRSYKVNGMTRWFNRVPSA